MKILKTSQNNDEIYKTKDGLPLGFNVRFSKVEPRGFHVYIVTCKINLEKYMEYDDIGYMKVAWIPEEEWNNLVGDNVWKFRKKMMGNYDIKDNIIDLPTESQRKEAIIDYNSENFSFRDSEYFYKKEFEIASNKYEQWEEHWVNKPHVDFINVEREFRRNGIGTNLYLFTANWLKTEFGLQIHRSDLLSDHAENFHKNQKTLNFKKRKGIKSKDRYFVDV